jgi:hypothetical protein
MVEAKCIEVRLGRNMIPILDKLRSLIRQYVNSCKRVFSEQLLTSPLPRWTINKLRWPKQILARSQS